MTRTRWLKLLVLSLIVCGALTGTALAASSPTVATLPATNVTSTSALLHGRVTPNGRHTQYFFSYGPTTAYGITTKARSAGRGTKPVSVKRATSGLTPGTVYHYRIVAVSPAGTVDGADQTFTAGGTSSVHVLGREGFVSPGDVIGIQIGCFGGVTTCSGHFTVTHGTTVVGEHSYTIPPESGGFHNFKLTPAGHALLSHNKVNHLLGVTVTVKDNSGQTVQFTVHLAKWFWHA